LPVVPVVVFPFVPLPPRSLAAVARSPLYITKPLLLSNVPTAAVPD